MECKRGAKITGFSGIAWERLSIKNPAKSGDLRGKL